jgi:NAD(P)-dependent dehydrogenase (short-subunit alcohol dehydrogenase family)
MFTSALENARKGIRVNAVAPYVSGGMMDTFLAQSPSLREHILGDLAMGRLADPEEVADAVVFLSSPSASYINGHTLVVDGGSSLQLANRLFNDS